MILAIFFINILIFTSIKTEIIQNNFNILTNKDINSMMDEISLISSANKIFGLCCLTLCNSNPNCLTAVYDYSKININNCFTYSQYIKATELIPSKTSIVYEKKKGKIYY
jgi:hypothetical protein